MTSRRRKSVSVWRTIATAVSIIMLAPVGFAQQQQQPNLGNALTLPPASRQEVIPSSPPPPITAPLGQPEGALEVPSLALRSQPGYEQVTVTVTDSSGKYVTDLKEDDFRVLENGEQRSIGFFRSDASAPVSVGIVVDSSGSMERKLPQARTAITRLVQDLDRNDDIFVMAFSDLVYMPQPFTNNHFRVIAVLRFLRSLDGTALYDAVFDALMYLAQGRHDKKALLVVTDGMDNRSKHQLDDVVDLARKMKVLIYSIGIGEHPPSNPGLLERLLGKESWVDVDTLTKLSEETGAKTFILPAVGEGDVLSKDCEAISNELRQQYTVAYLSPDPGRGGYRTLRVDIPKHPDLSVRVRKGVAVNP